MRPDVSIAIPCYNYGRYLRGCVESVLGQSGVDLRVLIIDDASEDSTKEVARELAQSDERIEYRRHRQNCGHIATFNEGIEWASCDYTMLLSADDLLTEGALERATEVLEATPDASFAFGRVAVWAENNPRPETSHHRAGSTTIYSGEQWIERVCRSGKNTIKSPEVLVRTAAQKSAGGYRAELPYTSDMEMWLRLALCGPVCELSSVQALYRVHASNMHHLAMTSTLDIEQRREAFRIFFETNGQSLPNHDRLRTAALQSLSDDEVVFFLDSSPGRRQSATAIAHAVLQNPRHMMTSRRLPGYLARFALGGERYNRLRTRLVD